MGANAEQLAANAAELRDRLQHNKKIDQGKIGKFLAALQGIIPGEKLCAREVGIALVADTETLLRSVQGAVLVPEYLLELARHSPESLKPARELA